MFRYQLIREAACSAWTSRRRCSSWPGPGRRPKGWPRRPGSSSPPARAPGGWRRSRSGPADVRAGRLHHALFVSGLTEGALKLCHPPHACRAALHAQGEPARRRFRPGPAGSGCSRAARAATAPSARTRCWSRTSPTVPSRGQRPGSVLLLSGRCLRGRRAGRRRSVQLEGAGLGREPGGVRVKRPGPLRGGTGPNEWVACFLDRPGAALSRKPSIWDF